mgnify:CR=1 FL=1
MLRHVHATPYRPIATQTHQHQHAHAVIHICRTSMLHSNAFSAQRAHFLKPAPIHTVRPACPTGVHIIHMTALKARPASKQAGQTLSLHSEHHSILGQNPHPAPRTPPDAVCPTGIPIIHIKRRNSHDAAGGCSNSCCTAHMLWPMRTACTAPAAWSSSYHPRLSQTAFPQGPP